MDDIEFDPLQSYPNMPAGYLPEAFASPETNHLQYYQDADANEWKWETTQNLQRECPAVSHTNSWHIVSLIILIFSKPL